MACRARWLLLPLCLLLTALPGRAADARFDLVGPRIDVRVTRGLDSLPIASVPNLQPGDRLWLHPDLPRTQSVKYLLICVFLRGTTNPPPDSWFIRINTWERHVREEGVFVTVPPEAQQAVLFMAPETGGDFSTLRSAVQGTPGTFVRASQDLAEAGFEQARIEKYLASIRRVPPADPSQLQKHSDLLARTLALKPDEKCFQRPVDMQFTCLTQTGAQTLLDDGHGNSIVNALSNGPGSDFIQAASYTGIAGAGVYSAYVGAVVDLVRLMGSLHTAKYQYIPAIAFPQGNSLNLRLNTPPSFHNPKSVLVIGLPAIQPAKPPPLRPADASHVACLLRPSVVLPIEGAPLVFSTDLAHNLVLHLNTPPGAPKETDIPLVPDAYSGGLVLQRGPEHHTPLHDPQALPVFLGQKPAAAANSTKPPAAPKSPSAPEPVLLTGTIEGEWGFDSFIGPTVQLQQLPGTGWQIVTPNGPASNLIAGHSSELLLTSTGTACVHTITARPNGGVKDLTVPFKPDDKSNQTGLLALSIPLQHELSPGDLHLSIQQFGQPAPDPLSAHTFSEPPQITSAELHAGDKTLLLSGTGLNQIEKLSLGDLVFSPLRDNHDLLNPPSDAVDSLRLVLPSDAPRPPTHLDEHLVAEIDLHDGRTLRTPVTVSASRPVITLLSEKLDGTPPSDLTLSNPGDAPLSAQLVFTLKSHDAFPRNGQIEVETTDGTLRTVLTLAPSGGLLLQDPHTVVATLDPLRSFGPSAFGALKMRALFPAPEVRATRRAESESDHAEGRASGRTEAALELPDDATSDWVPLVTLVRLPTLTLLQCPADATQPCTLTGSDLFLIQSISTDPAFANPQQIPDGFTGTTLTVPHPIDSTLFVKLRDDPAHIDSAIVPSAVPAVVTAHTRGSGHS